MRKTEKEIIDLYNSIDDINIASREIGDNYPNAALYLKEALESGDDSRLVMLKSVDLTKKQQRVLEEKQQKIEYLLGRIDFTLLTSDDLSNNSVQEYIQKQNELILELRDLIK